MRSIRVAEPVPEDEQAFTTYGGQVIVIPPGAFRVQGSSVVEVQQAVRSSDTTDIIITN